MVAHNRIPGGLLSVLLAGPLFMAGLALGDAASRWPAAIVYTPNEIWPFLGISLIAIPFGVALSILPVMFGVLIMSWLGARHPPLRSSRAWMVAGAVCGVGIASIWGGEKPLAVGVALIFTSATCARIARCWVRWVPNVDQPRSALTPAVAIKACPAK